ncbi:MAG: rod shape-determining protein MreC [Candidatus Zixiibacteriota bacterium]|nr:MAG: rod shape-determining protein MreC [candidate division Zixibacteria bacterium]
MSWITNLFAKNWRNVHFLAIILVSLALIVLTSNFRPVINQVIVSVFYWPFAELKNGVGELASVSRENRELREELTEASVVISMYEEAARENERLRSVLGFEPPPRYRLLPADIISVAGSYFPVSAIINRGLDDSLYVDQPVINQQGLIGRIAAVSRDFGVVQLLTDPTSRVAARLAGSREMGIVRFTVSEGMILDNFHVQGMINAGDTVLSSGLGGVYPPGLIVGVVHEVERPEREPFCKVRVDPAVNFYSID